MESRHWFLRSSNRVETCSGECAQEEDNDQGGRKEINGPYIIDGFGGYGGFETKLDDVDDSHDYFT